MERVLGGADKLVTDLGGQGGQGVVPYLPLNELTTAGLLRRTGTAATTGRSKPMKSGVSGIVALFVVLLIVVVGYAAIFTVRQTEQVLVVRLGEPVRVVTEPGCISRLRSSTR